MKLSWFAKEFTAVLVVVAVSILLLIWAIVEASDSHQYSVVAIGFAGGFIPILIEFIVAYRNGTLFIKDKKAVAARRARNRRLAKLSFIPAVVFGMVALRFPESVKVLLLSLAAGYLLPYSIGLCVHFLKNHKEIEKIAKDL